MSLRKRSIGRQQQLLSIITGLFCCILPFLSLSEKWLGYQQGLGSCAVLLCSLILWRAVSQKQKPISLTACDIAFFLYLIYGGIHFFLYREKIPLYFFSHWTVLIAGYLLARNGGSRHLPFFLGTSCMLQAVIAAGQFAGIIESNHPLFRLTGSFWNPSQLGGFIACFFPLIAKQFLIRRSPLWHWLCLLPVLFILVLSDSRAAWLACFLGLLYAFPIRINNRFKTGMIILGLSLSIIGIVGLYSYRPLSAWGN